jgi:hypothetical protein
MAGWLIYALRSSSSFMLQAFAGELELKAKAKRNRTVTFDRPSMAHRSPGRSLANAVGSVVRAAVRALFCDACADHRPIDSIIVCALLRASSSSEATMLAIASSSVLQFAQFLMDEIVDRLTYRLLVVCDRGKKQGAQLLLARAWVLGNDALHDGV